MRKVGGLLLVMLAMGAALLGAANASAMSFPDITSAAAPEEYAFELELSEALELRQIDEGDVGVFYKEGGLLSYTLSADPAHDADGATVPTSLTMTGSDQVTLTVRHREGNPAAGGAPFAYPIIGGAGWKGGYRTVTVPLTEPVPPVGTSAPAEPAKPRQVRVIRALGEDKLYYRPHFFLLSGDGTFGMNRVRWQSYGGANAKATARAYVDDCIPYCAAGHVTHPQATVRLSKVIDCTGTPIYAHLEYAISGPLPKGFPRRSGYSMRPLGEDGKPEC